MRYFRYTLRPVLLTLLCVLAVVGIIVPAFVVPRAEAQATTSCYDADGARRVTSYGAFTPDATDTATVAANTATIKRAIDEAGKAGGGTICLPAGTYHPAPADLAASWAAAIVINRDRITLWGEGIGRTILRTRSDWSLINGSVTRGHGIRIVGTSDSAKPRHAITLKQFELDGGLATRATLVGPPTRQPAMAGILPTKASFLSPTITWMMLRLIACMSIAIAAR